MELGSELTIKPRDHRDNARIEAVSFLYRAAKIAEQAHAGQTDKTGRPYIEHCRRVVDAVETLDQKAVAYLHDVLEKSHDWDRERLETAGFGTSIVSAVDAMTRRPDEDNLAFVRRAAANPLARPVKRADLADNLWQAKQIGASTSKYEDGLRILDEEYSE
jgi:(p)ppGpp synthase/HD superfamily hydrolase